MTLLEARSLIASALMLRGDISPQKWSPLLEHWRLGTGGLMGTGHWSSGRIANEKLLDGLPVDHWIVDKTDEEANAIRPSPMIPPLRCWDHLLSCSVLWSLFDSVVSSQEFVLQEEDVIIQPFCLPCLKNWCACNTKQPQTSRWSHYAKVEATSSNSCWIVAKRTCSTLNWGSIKSIWSWAYYTIAGGFGVARRSFQKDIFAVLDLNGSFEDAAPARLSLGFILTTR
ncbi:hypothetical protein J6590_029983 [Homalodisca vitripennis]|nr:hypothetical protein J6590_029983 [Homalodisca vitripennis]